jgi:ABC-type transport system involved in cytochrome c biogenesis permease subunit
MGALIGVGIFISLFFIITGVVFGVDYIISYWERVFGE